MSLKNVSFIFHDNYAQQYHGCRIIDRNSPLKPIGKNKRMNLCGIRK